jgi:hypothetical protein
MKFVIKLPTLALFLASVAGREAPASAPALAHVATRHVPWSRHFLVVLIDDTPPGPAPHSKKASFKVILSIIGSDDKEVRLLLQFGGPY